MTVILLAVLAEPVILLGMLAGLVKLGLLTAHLHKPDKPPTCERYAEGRGRGRFLGR